MDGVKNQTLHNDAKGRIIEFTFAPGAELKAHSSPLPASAYVARGVAIFQMGDAEAERLAGGRFMEIPPGAVHSVRADASGEMVLVLTIWK
ncbi:MAG: cupin domain-containing protein [Acidobacteria bacterium]|nr:cupin domain-containing protein [Acidobacteriota bacterium]